MTTDLSRRTLLRLCGAASLAGAMAGAVRAEGGATSGALTALPFALSTPMHVGEVALKVRDPQVMRRYYGDMLGLQVIDETDGVIRMGAGGVPLLHLIHRPDAAFEQPSEAGLFHTAFLMPSRADLARWLVHIAMSEVQITGFADHSVSEAVYLNDPEGNGVEVYSDRPRDAWQWEGEVVTMGTKPLDIDAILAGTDTTRDQYAAAPDGLRIGHIHLKVGAIDAGRSFYETGIGLASTRGKRPDAAFLSSGGYHHHVAMNIWNSEGAGLRKADATGLDWFSLTVPDDATLAAQRQRLAQAGFTVSEFAGGVAASDPWGTVLRLVRA